jgi:transposase
VEQAYAEFAEALSLGRPYLRLVREHRADELDAWLERSAGSTLVAFRWFATSLRRDYAAVRAALEQPWRTGPVEGHRSKLKMMKRQMYGRKKLDLLSKRVRYAA